MGDMADYYAEQELATFGDIENDPPPSLSRHVIKTCYCCGRTNLHWEQRRNKWVLCDDRGIHKCSKHPLVLGKK